MPWYAPAPATTREVLARLDERTERLDRDIRQMLLGQRAHGEAMERKLDELAHSMNSEFGAMSAIVSSNRERMLANEALVQKHDEWFNWAIKIILAAVVGAVLVAAGVSL